MSLGTRGPGRKDCLISPPNNIQETDSEELKKKKVVKCFGFFSLPAPCVSFLECVPLRSQKGPRLTSLVARPCGLHPSTWEDR